MIELKYMYNFESRKDVFHNLLRILREEEEKGGLVIVAALYGLLVSNRYNIIKNLSSSTSHKKLRDSEPL